MKSSMAASGSKMSFVRRWEILFRRNIEDRAGRLCVFDKEARDVVSVWTTSSILVNQ